MKSLELIDLLRQRIAVYRDNKTATGGLTEFELTCCTAIELSVIFAELHYKLNRKISDHELHNFKGGRFISDVIGSERGYEDMYELYYELANHILNR